MNILAVVVVILGALTAASVGVRHMWWLRLLVVLACGGFIAFLAAFGISNAARFGMIEDRTLLDSTVRYGDAYKAGLLAAQRSVDRDWPLWFVVSVYLAVLALVPVRRRPRKGESSGSEPA